MALGFHAGTEREDHTRNQRNVFDVDERNIFCKFVFAHMATTRGHANGKTVKNCIKVLLCANVEGLEKINIIFTGTSS